MQPNFATGLTNLFVTVFSYVTTWFQQIYQATGMATFYLATILIAFLIRILIIAIGQMPWTGSDRSKRKDNSNE